MNLPQPNTATVLQGRNRSPSRTAAAEPPWRAWNRTEKSYAPCRALHLLFEAQLERDPAAIAVVAPAEGAGEEDTTLTYGELNRRANQLAHYLLEHEAGPDVLVGIFAERSLAMVIAVLAIFKTGAAYVPLDPTYPEERLNFMLEDTQASIILTQEKLLPQLPKGRKSVICLDHEAQFIAQQRENNLEPRAEPDHLAYVIYTSGSTGRPKGVAMRQGALINLLRWQIENPGFRGAARTLQFASLNFDVSFQEIFSAWCSGGALILIPDKVRRDSAALLHFLSHHHIERIFLPFVALKHLAEAAVLEGTVPRALKEVITAGEQLKITPALVEFFSKLKGCALENQYGPSETHVVTSYRLTGSPQSWPLLPPIGRPVANARVYLLNEQLRPVGVGEPGELYLGGECLARGYLNNPEITAAKFVRDPFSDNPCARLYKTGDLGRYLPDGNIEFLGRLDHQVKIGGVRVELGEIEAALHQHPSVKEAVAVARVQRGFDDKRLIAYVVPQPGQKAMPSELRAFLKRKLPANLLPATFVPLEFLPLNPNGKVDRLALPEPGEPEEDFSTPVEPPHTPLQMELLLVFERFLNRRPIGINVSFFELGGDSLQALNLIIELQRVTGKKLPLGILYQAPTIELLAKAIQNQNGSQWSAMVPLQPLGQRPPLFLVHTAPGDVLAYGGLVYHLGTDQPCYGFQSLGYDQPQQAHTRIEEMAAHYIKLMRSLQATGPYYLGGWCYGGIVAVEIAQQLTAAGQQVGFLGLLETPAPAPSWRRCHYYLRRLVYLSRMKPSALWVYFREKIRYYRGLEMTNALRFRRVESGDGREAQEVADHNRYLERLEFVYATNGRALKLYRSRPYPGRVTLFTAEEQDPALIRDPQYGWFGLAQEIETHFIPGSHDTILMEPQVRALAEKMKRCLEQAMEKKDTAGRRGC